MSRAVFVGRAAAAAVLVSLCAPPAARAQTVTPPLRRVVLLLAPGASLADWRGPHTPTLARLAETALVAVMPTRAPDSAPASAYRTIAFGTRSPGRADRSLGDMLRAAGIPVMALGGPGARIVAGLPEAGDGEAAWRVRVPEAPDGVAADPARLADTARQALRRAATPTLVIIDFDDLARADAYAPVALPRATAEQRRAALRRLDTLIARLTTAPGEPFTLLVVTPRPSAAASARGERLGPVLLWQAETPLRSSLLASPTTRGTPGLIANTDVAATVAALLGLPRQSQAIGAGRVIEAVSPPGGEVAGSYLERRAREWAAQVREQKLLIFVPWALAGALLLAAAWQRGRYGPLAALWAASVPAALALAAPLAPDGVKQAGIVYLIAFGFSLVPPLLSLRFGPRPLVIGVCAVTALTLVLDTFSGGPLLARSPFSYSVVEAARYYGIGNEAAGALLGASLIAVSGVGLRARVISGLIVAATLGLPRWGADFGGLIAALAGFVTLLGAERGGSGGAGTLLARRRVLVLIGVAAALAAAFVLWEASRGAQARTHVGQAVTAAREHGFAPLGEIAARKIALGARLLITSPWAVLLLAEVVTAVWLYRQRRARATAVLTGNDAAAALRAAAVAGLAALLVNDSGVVAAAACLLYPAARLLVEAGQAEER